VDEREVLHVRYERNTVAVEKAYAESSSRSGSRGR
jgi:hypothetical protein